MPIEIKELVIRAVIAPDSQGRDTQPSATGNEAAPQAVATEDIVQECVRQVLRILQRERER